MRRWLCVPMMLLCCLALGACGLGDKKSDGAELRQLYREMTGCTMEATVSCTQGEQRWTALLRCDCNPNGDTVVEVLEPETIAGVRAILRGEDLQLEYQDLCLDAGTVSREEISPMECLPRLIRALQNGWLLEENQEDWGEIPCLRLTVDESGKQGGKILSTLWLKASDGTPIRGEIAVADQIILTAEFTKFAFCDKMIN